MNHLHMIPKVQEVDNPNLQTVFHPWKQGPPIGMKGYCAYSHSLERNNLSLIDKYDYILNYCYWYKNVIKLRREDTEIFLAKLKKGF